MEAADWIDGVLAGTTSPDHPLRARVPAYTALFASIRNDHARAAHAAWTPPWPTTASSQRRALIPVAGVARGGRVEHLEEAVGETVAPALAGNPDRPVWMSS